MTPKEILCPDCNETMWLSKAEHDIPALDGYYDVWSCDHCLKLVLDGRR